MAVYYITYSLHVSVFEAPDDISNTIYMLKHADGPGWEAEFVDHLFRLACLRTAETAAEVLRRWVNVFTARSQTVCGFGNPRLCFNKVKWLLLLEETLSIWASKVSVHRTISILYHSSFTAFMSFSACTSTQTHTRTEHHHHTPFKCSLFEPSRCCWCYKTQTCSVQLREKRKAGTKSWK